MNGKHCTSIKLATIIDPNACKKNRGKPRQLGVICNNEKCVELFSNAIKMLTQTCDVVIHKTARNLTASLFCLETKRSGTSIEDNAYFSKYVTRRTRIHETREATMKDLADFSETIKLDFVDYERADIAPLPQITLKNRRLNLNEQVTGTFKHTEKSTPLFIASEHNISDKISDILGKENLVAHQRTSLFLLSD